MVAIKAAQVQATINRPNADHRCFLIYGPDAGLVSERAKALAKKLANLTAEPGEIIRLDETDMDGDPDRLHVELRTVSMFGGAKIIRLRFGPKIRPETFGDFLADERIEGRLIVEAGNLRKDAKLRKLFESSKTAVALPCYADTGQGLDALIDEILNPLGLRIAPDARGTLISLLGADRVLSRSEIGKLALYTAGTEKITVEDVKDIVGDASELAVDRIINAAFTGDPNAAVREFDRALGSGQTVQGVLLGLQRHVLRLLRVRAASDAGQSSDQAMRLLRPPLYGRDRDGFIRQTHAWPAGRLSGVQRAVAATIRQSRTEARLEQSTAAKLLLDIGRSAGQGRRS